MGGVVLDVLLGGNGAPQTAREHNRFIAPEYLPAGAQTSTFPLTEYA
jgi:hypothetical protein